MIDRRTVLLASASAALAGMWSPSKAQPLPTRYNVASQQGKEMLRIYAAAVRSMKELDARNTRSWTFEWYIHATPIPKEQAIKNVFDDTTGPARILANDAWATCQPHFGQAEDYFLPWHRLYVLYLEQIVRDITSHQEFTLPYWDYTNPGSYSIPEEFRTSFKNDPVFGTLYMPNRNTDDGIQYANVNAGEPLNKYFTGVQNFLVLPVLTQPNYSTFCGLLDNNLHGNVHDFTGDGTNMGSVSTAARDPIFWLHHSNIDRIWAAWNQAGGRNPTQTNGVAWKDTEFIFAAGNGKRVKTAISTIGNPSALPYRYDSLPGAPAANRVAVAASSTGIVLLRSTPPASVNAAAPGAGSAAIPLGASPVTVPLAPTSAQNRLIAVAPQIQSGSSHVILTLRGVQADANPKTVYRVYLDLPANAPPQIADQHYLGLLNFFGATMEPGHGMHGKTAEFDVTDVISRLAAQNALQNETSVTLVPVGPPASGSVISSGIELRQE